MSAPAKLLRSDKKIMSLKRDADNITTYDRAFLYKRIFCRNSIRKKNYRTQMEFSHSINSFFSTKRI